LDLSSCFCAVSFCAQALVEVFEKHTTKEPYTAPAGEKIKKGEWQLRHSFFWVGVPFKQYDEGTGVVRQFLDGSEECVATKVPWVSGWSGRSSAGGTTPSVHWHVFATGKATADSQPRKCCMQASWLPQFACLLLFSWELLLRAPSGLTPHRFNIAYHYFVHHYAAPLEEFGQLVGVSTEGGEHLHATHYRIANNRPAQPRGDCPQAVIATIRHSSLKLALWRQKLLMATWHIFNRTGGNHL
jgi:hypothetical protein